MSETRVAYRSGCNIGGELPKWRGKTVWKYPGDFLLYHAEIFDKKPDWIIETGTMEGGSTLFFGDMLDMISAPGKVLSIDINPIYTPLHKKVEYIKGSSSDRELVEQIKKRVSGKVMVILDSSHTTKHVWREIRLLAPLVTVGQAMVVEDCYVLKDADELRPRNRGPEDAIFKFLRHTRSFVREYPEKKFIRPTEPHVYIAHAITSGGWLRRVR